jgi:hypothetical protein
MKTFAQLPTLETPDGLHPNQYATRLVEEINFPIVPNNIRASSARATPSQKTVRLRHFSLATGSAGQSRGITAMDDKLAWRQADPNALSNLSLTPSFPLRRCRF